MYKVLLVDDEADVRDGLVHEIDWPAFGFTVAGTAENGKEAIDLCERLVPDVVITDISMPFLDGLKFSEWLQEYYPLTKIVILTGYDEFDYAQRAVRLNVDEYLLKPFSSDNLTEVLFRIGTKMEVERAEREDVRKLKEHYRTSLPLLRATFLSSLLSRKMSRGAIEEKLDKYELQLSGDRYSIAVISLHQPHSKVEGAPDYSLRGSGDLELKLFAVVNIAEEIWRQQQRGYVFIHQDEVIILSVGTDDRENWTRQTEAALESVLRNIEHYLQITVTIGVGPTVDRLTEIKYSYEDALSALDYQLVLGSGKIIYIHDVERRPRKKLRFDELKEQALVRCLKVGTTEELPEVVESIFQEITEDDAYSDVQLYLIEVMTVLIKTAKDADADAEELFGSGLPSFAELFKLTSLLEAQRWFLDLCMAIMKRISSKRQHSYKDIVDKAISYIKNHFNEPDLSIQKICSHLHVSPGYFYGIFKKEVKMTFVQYVMHIRMEIARELLRTTELKAFEIGERVGIVEPNYFSFCFKKQVGVSPREYRNSGMAFKGGSAT